MAVRLKSLGFNKKGANGALLSRDSIAAESQLAIAAAVTTIVTTAVAIAATAVTTTAVTTTAVTTTAVTGHGLARDQLLATHIPNVQR
jgi:hypothetical protein